MSDFTIIMNPKHQNALKKFISYLQKRLIRIKQDIKDGDFCGKLVLRPKNYYGRMITQRCYGHVGKHGCYNCDHTGFSCEQCGDVVGSAEEKFCGGYCEWEYYGKQDNWRSRY